MAQDLIDRWTDIRKPLFLTPKDFRDRVLVNMESEIKLNYIKWLTNGLEIDMFSILTILVIYSRATLIARL